MVEDRLTEIPHQVTVFRQHYPTAPPPHYDDTTFQDAKNGIRASLREIQKHICAYCESSFSQHAHKTRIDHIIPQVHAPEKSIDPFNMVLSCDHKYTCDAHKGDNLLKYLEPNPGCNQYLQLETDGTLIPNPDLSQDIQTAIAEELGHLNLNAPHLKTERARRIDNLITQRLSNEELPAYFEISVPYSWILRRFFNLI